MNSQQKHMDLAAIKDYWERSAEAFDAQTPITPTSRDPFLAEMERQNVLDQLSPSDRVLEVGCGVAVHTVHYARGVKDLTGIDVAPALLKHAAANVLAAGIHNVALRECSVLDLERNFGASRFDVVISQRCLINLPTWDHQRAALGQIATVLRPGGLLLLSEGFQDELDALNEIRIRVGLMPIRVVDFNRNFVHAEFDMEIARNYEIVQKRDYGMYLLLSRVLHPLAVAPDQPRHDGPINRAAMTLSAAPAADKAFERLSYNLFYALKRR